MSFRFQTLTMQSSFYKYFNRDFIHLSFDRILDLVEWNLRGHNMKLLFDDYMTCTYASESVDIYVYIFEWRCLEATMW